MTLAFWLITFVFAAVEAAAFGVVHVKARGDKRYVFETQREGDRAADGPDAPLRPRGAGVVEGRALSKLFFFFTCACACVYVGVWKGEGEWRGARPGAVGGAEQPTSSRQQAPMRQRD